MPEFRFKTADEGDHDALNHIWAHVYGDGDTSEALDPPSDGQTYYIGYVDGTPAWAAQTHTYDIVRRPWDFTLKCAGVAGVATLVEHRNSGLAQFCMRRLLEECRSLKFDVSLLYAYRDSYYRKVGYGTCGWRWHIKVPATRLPKLVPQLPARQLKAEECESALGACYLQFISKFSGSHVRSSASWKQRLGRKPSFIYAVGDPVEGYFWGRGKEFWGELEIGELAWSTRKGYESVLATIRGMANNQTTVSWNEPARSPYLSQYFDQDSEFTMHRPTMARIIDLPGLLAKVPGGDGLVIEVDDPCLPENSGRWACGPSAGRTDKETNASGPIAAWSQALFGQPSVDDLITEGQIDAQPNVVPLLNQLLPASPVVCMEFF